MTTEQPAPREAAGEPPVDSGNDRPRYESFVWRLRIDHDGGINDTSIQHVGSGETKHWPTWDTAAMLEFVMARATGTPPEAVPAATPPEGEAATAPQPATGPPDIKPAGAGPTGARPAAAQASELATVAALRLAAPPVAAGERLRLDLDLDFGPDGGQPYRFVYDLVVMARRLDGELNKVVARENGTLEVGRPRITVDADGLEAGLYRLDAALTLSKPSMGFRGRTAFVEGVMLTVWPA